MSARETPARPAGGLLLAVAQRLAPAATRERVLLPLIADFQHEHAMARSGPQRFLLRLRWGAAFLRAFASASAPLAVDHLRRNVWGRSPDEAAATQLALAHALAWALAVTIVLMLDLLRRPYVRHPLPVGSMSATSLLLLAPSALTFALTAGALFGSVTTSGRTASRRARLDAAVLLAVVTFGMAAWVTPLANAAYRAAALEAIQTDLPGISFTRSQPGDREMTLGQLSTRSIALRAQGRPSAPLDTEWHKKPALAFSCVALAVLGAALARRLSGPWARGLAAFGAFAAFYWMLRAGETAADAGRLAPALAMWGPPVLIAAAALALGAGRDRGREGTGNGTTEPAFSA